MPADKEIMKALETLRLDRPGRAHEAFWGDVSTPELLKTETALSAALRELATTYREEAGLWAKSGARGWKGSETEAYVIAQAVDDVATALDKQPAEPPSSAAAREPLPRQHADTTPERLADFVAGAVAEGRGMLRKVTVEPGPLDMGEALGVTPDQYAVGRLADVGAYLSGAVDTLPGLAEALVPGSVTSAAEADDPFNAMEARVGAAPLPPLTINDCTHGADCPLHPEIQAVHNFDADAMPKTWSSETMTADGHRIPQPAGQAPTLGQPGDMGAGYDHAYVPPGGRRYTFADLLTPVPVASLPRHLSHSQADTVGDCGVKYRLQKVEQLPQIPQWANIGGTAFHAAVEAFERTVAKMGDRTTDGQPMSWAAYDCETVWKHHFEGQIAAVQATTTVPISVWRAARRGAEGRAWWEINGPLMLRRYLDARPAEPTSNLPAMVASENGSPFQLAIELDLTVDVPTPYGPIPFNGKLDRVTNGEQVEGSNWITLVIRDYKTSYERPTDTTQLGDYAWTLRLWGVPESVRILGTYFDARRGEWTEPVDLLAAHPFEAFQYRVTTAHAQKRALTTGPTPARPSSYCGGCSVRYACPVMASKS